MFMVVWGVVYSHSSDVPFASKKVNEDHLTSHGQKLVNGIVPAQIPVGLFE